MRFKHNSPFIQFISLSLYLHRKLILWLAIGFGLLFLFTANMGPTYSPLYGFGLFVGGALISINAFKDVHDKGTNIQYLTLPISTRSRYLAIWLLTGPVYLAFMTLLYGMGILAHVFAKTFWDFGSLTPLLWVAGKYLMVNAFFLFGSITFKKLPLVKTLFGLLLLGLIIVILRGVVEEAELPSYGVALGNHILWAALGVLAWWGAYWKLKKSELR